MQHFPDIAAEDDAVYENIQTAEEATEATEVNAGSGEEIVDVAQTGVYTEHVFTDPLGVQDTVEDSTAYPPRYMPIIFINRVYGLSDRNSLNYISSKKCFRFVLCWSDALLVCDCH